MLRLGFGSSMRLQASSIRDLKCTSSAGRRKALCVCVRVCVCVCVFSGCSGFRMGCICRAPNPPSLAGIHCRHLGLWPIVSQALGVQLATLLTKSPDPSVDLQQRPSRDAMNYVPYVNRRATIYPDKDSIRFRRASVGPMLRERLNPKH